MTTGARAFLLAGIACSAALVPLAALLPLESSASVSYRVGDIVTMPMVTLVRIHGPSVLVLAAVPCMVALAVAVLMHVAFTTRWHWAVSGAWVLSSLVILGAVLGTVTFVIGILVLPAGALLVTSCALMSESLDSSPAVVRPA